MDKKKESEVIDRGSYLAKFAKEYLVPGIVAATRSMIGAYEKRVRELEEEVRGLKARISRCEGLLTTESREVVEELLRRDERKEA